MLRHRSPTQYAVEIEKEIFPVAAATLKHAIIEAMNVYYGKHGYPNLMNNPINYSVRVTNVASQRMYTFDVAAQSTMTYELKKEF